MARANEMAANTLAICPPVYISETKQLASDFLKDDQIATLTTTHECDAQILPWWHHGCALASYVISHDETITEFQTPNHLVSEMTANTLAIYPNA